MNTKASYESALKLFSEFRLINDHADIWPPPLGVVIDFIAFMSLKGMSPSTARCYISGIAFACKVKDLSDPTGNFIISKMLNGFKKMHRRVDTRLPITHELLERILRTLPTVCYTSYEAELFSAVFSLAFFGFFRVGELVISSLNNEGHALRVNDLHLENGNSAIKVFLRSSKTDQQGHGVVLIIPNTGKVTCPVRHMLLYLKMRKSLNCIYLFCHLNSLPVTRYQFAAVLKKSLNMLGLQNANYKCHSFRIGAATTASRNGLSDEKIQSYGRWKSCAFKSYIRIPSDVLTLSQ